MSDLYGRRIQVISSQRPPEDHARPQPELELHGQVLYQTRADRESRVLWLKEDLEDTVELGPYDADAFEVAWPVKAA